jgi:hypothetical protein
MKEERKSTKKLRQENKLSISERNESPLPLKLYFLLKTSEFEIKT